MPFRYAEVAKVLLDMYVCSRPRVFLLIILRAPDDIMEPDKIRILLKDIREARQAKSRQLLLTLDTPHTAVCIYFISVLTAE